MTSMPLVDCHAHLGDLQFFTQIRKILEQSETMGCCSIMANAASVYDWERLLSIYDAKNVDLAIGIHPFYAEQWNTSLCRKMLAHIKSGKIKGIGEIGLDCWNGRENLQIQKAALREQLLIARDYNLPVCLHNRKSWNEFFDLADKCKLASIKGYCHGFTGSMEVAKQLLNMGLYISFGRSITNKNAVKACSAAQFIPVERILTETDSPVVNIDLFPGQVHNIVLELAKLKKISPDLLKMQVQHNYHTLIKL